MSQNYLQPGEHITIAAAPAAVESGQGLIVGDLFGVASGNAESGEEVVLAVEGVFALEKVSSESFAVGAAVYYDVGVFAATSVNTHKRIGVAIKEAGSGDTTVEVRLSGAW